jgi:hypothetical protein
MRKYTFIIGMLLCLIFIGSIQGRAASDWTGNVNLTFGKKSAEEDRFVHKLDDKREVGINVDFGKRLWPIHIAFALLRSSSNEHNLGNTVYVRYVEPAPTKSKIEYSTTEIRLGIMNIWEPTSTIRIYFSAGVARIDAEKRITEISSEYGHIYSEAFHAQRIAPWINIGTYWTLSTHYNLGIEIGRSVHHKAIRWNSWNDTSEGIQIEGTHSALFIGYHW